MPSRGGTVEQHELPKLGLNLTNTRVHQVIDDPLQRQIQSLNIAGHVRPDRRNQARRGLCCTVARRRVRLIQDVPTDCAKANQDEEKGHEQPNDRSRERSRARVSMRHVWLLPWPKIPHYLLAD